MELIRDLLDQCLQKTREFEEQVLKALLKDYLGREINDEDGRDCTMTFVEGEEHRYLFTHNNGAAWIISRDHMIDNMTWYSPEIEPYKIQITTERIL